MQAAARLPCPSSPSVHALAITDVLERRHPGRRAQLKRDILQAALACFNEHGLEPTTIEMVRLRCNTSVGNIYHHFGNKEGLVSALFFAALEDQARLREDYFSRAATAQEGIAALVHGYVDWVTAEPELARFQYQARAAVAQGPQADELAQRNRERNRTLLAWFDAAGRREQLPAGWPPELLPSLLVGQAEHYCRAWLSGRVQASPRRYREHLARAAWAALSGQADPSAAPAASRRR